MKRKTQWIVFGVVLIMCIASLGFWYYVHLPHGPTYARSWSSITIALNVSSKEKDNYTITVLAISDNLKPTSDVRWYTFNESDYSIASSNFPTASGEEESTANRGIIVTWFDENNDGKLSTNDTIRVYKGWHNLDGCKFALFYKTYTELGRVKL
jgi:hypothetical protein